MNVLVAYATRHGATRGIAERIATTLEHDGLEATLASVDEVPSVDRFDAFVIGSSVYMLHWEKAATEFVRRNIAVLAARPVWLFGSGPVGTDKVDKAGHDILEAARPREFARFADLVQPRAAKVFFGAYDPTREGATFAERLVMKMPAIRDALPAGDFRDWAAIEGWADSIARELQGSHASALILA